MSQKSKPSPGAGKGAQGTHRMAQRERSPAERLAEVERQATARGIRPIEDFEVFLEEVGDAWPEEEDLDEFLTWLRRSRQEGRY